MLSVNIAIHAVPSDWSMVPPVGNGLERSKMAMLSRPRKPPWKMLRSFASLRFTHQVKLSSSLWNAISRNLRSACPVMMRSIWNTRSTAQACTGGFTSPNAHS